ncbi:MAG: hypothetical protein FJ404_11955 [Verrucomicrobia bacterium]|nr:hypothetical protein [Verrucomicrobiota bacterium]
MSRGCGQWHSQASAGLPGGEPPHQKRKRRIQRLSVMQVGRVRPGAPPEHDVLHPVGGGLGQARPTNHFRMHRSEMGPGNSF